MKLYVDNTSILDEGRAKQITPTIKAKAMSKYSDEIVEALSYNTPIDSGKTASSWKHVITVDGDLEIHNTSVTDRGVPIPVLIEYGHETKNKGYVDPRPFISTAVRGIETKMKNDKAIV